jgi:hypothetical protein
MRGGQARANLPSNFDGFVLREAADTAQERAEVFAVDVLHCEKRGAIDFADIVDSAHVGVRDAAGDPNFVLESLEHAFVTSGFFGQELHRYRLTKRQVVSAIDFAHATFAEQSDDSITSGDQAAREESAFADEIFGCGGGSGSGTL